MGFRGFIGLRDLGFRVATYVWDRKPTDDACLIRFVAFFGKTWTVLGIKRCHRCARTLPVPL